MAENVIKQYLTALKYPFQKIAKLEFLNPDNSVAFALDNQYKPGYGGYNDSRAFISGGDLSVSLQNGQRRKSSVTFSNVDGAFDFSVEKLWFGNQVRLSMGMVLPSGQEYYIPQGVFYLDAPVNSIKSNQKTITYNLVDKWAYLDGSLFGNIEGLYQVPGNIEDEYTETVFGAIQTILHLSRATFETTADISRMIDNVPPVFTNYYNSKTYQYVKEDGTVGTAPVLRIPYDVSSNGSFADVILELNQVIAGLIGYDRTGALRIEPSQDDVTDASKPVLWSFTPENCDLLSIQESAKNAQVYNDVIVVGESLQNREVYGRATNYDRSSDTNVNLIGKRTYREERASYWTEDQCIALAEYMLKQKTVLQKSVTIHSQQMFHLTENRLVTVKRTDKKGTPVERHLIQGFTLPIGDTGEMTINATSVVDNPISTTTSSWNLEE